MTKKTDFGFQKVDWQDKAKKVGEVFHSVANRYDVMNDLMSLGVHRLWKRHTMNKMRVRVGYKVLDLAGGTGDFSAVFAKQVGDDGQVILSDINASMLAVGRDRLIDKNILNVDIVQANAESLPFEDNYFDRIIIAFGLRNVTDKNAALKEMFRVLKPGGAAYVLEFSKPTSKKFSEVYDFYSFNILPKIGKFVAKDEASYQYLAESIRMHPDQETLKSMMLDAGFDKVDYENLTGGMVALHEGWK